MHRRLCDAELDQRDFLHCRSGDERRGALDGQIGKRQRRLNVIRLDGGTRLYSGGSSRGASRRQSSGGRCARGSCPRRFFPIVRLDFGPHSGCSSLSFLLASSRLVVPRFVEWFAFVAWFVFGRRRCRLSTLRVRNKSFHFFDTRNFGDSRETPLCVEERASLPSGSVWLVYTFARQSNAFYCFLPKDVKPLKSSAYSVAEMLKTPVGRVVFFVFLDFNRLFLLRSIYLFGFVFCV